MENTQQQLVMAEERCAGLANLIEAQTVELQAKEKEFLEALSNKEEQLKAGSEKSAAMEQMEKDLEGRLDAQAELEGMLQSALEDLETSKIAYTELYTELAGAKASSAELTDIQTKLSEKCERYTRFFFFIFSFVPIPFLLPFSPY